MALTVGAPREAAPGERRVALTPDSATRIQKLGYKVIMEAGAGAEAAFTDEDYTAAGVEIVGSAPELWEKADVVVKVREPIERADLGRHELDLLRADQTLVSFFYPKQNEEMLKQAAARNPKAVLAMDMVPRISRAQKMDALSSMANIAGYRAVIEAGNNFGRFFTGQVTAAGKVPPAKVLVVGAGVAGLAAIGAARGLGAIVRAFDVRPEVAEQIESMGAEFLFLDFDEEVGSEGGYAKPASPEFQAAQTKLFEAQAPEVDIVVTTALIGGTFAPKLWTEKMVKSMKNGSVIVDLAASAGGNCELTKPDEKIVTDNGVTIIGYTDFPSRMATQSSQLYATNVRHLLDDLTPEKDGALNVNMEDDVIRGATVVHGAEITFPPPPPKIQAIAAPPPKAKAEKVDPAEARRLEEEAARKAGANQMLMLAVGALLVLALGAVAPTSFMQHFIVFVLAVFVGFQVIWNVSHSLHTPLMAVTNAISGIVVVGAILQIGSSDTTVLILSAISVLIATINIFGGFLVTRRMLAMFQKS